MLILDLTELPPAASR